MRSARLPSLGEYLELSPRGHFFSWHRYLSAGAAEVKAVKDA
jgi:hypothetical protein